MATFALAFYSTYKRFPIQGSVHLARRLAGQASWEEVNQVGRQVRQLWADFARTGHLPVRVKLPGVLRVRQV